MSRWLTIFVISALAGEGTASAQPAAAKAIATVGEMHALLINPTSDAIFDVGRQAPATDGEWLAVQRNARLLAEAGNLLMVPGRAKDKTTWMRMARAMVDAASRAAAAARARRLDTLGAASDAIVISCENCHEPYRDHGRSMRR